MLKAATLEEEVQRDNKIVANYLLFYDELKKEYLRLRESVVLDSSYSYSSRVIHAGISFELELEVAERWLALIEEMEQRLPWKMQIFLRLRREYRHVKGNQGWTAAVQWRLNYEVAERLMKNPEVVWVESRFTFNNWWSKIVEYTARLAAKRGLLP